MRLTLEALEARHGDALLLHYGRADRPGLIVVDGGPAGVFRSVLAPRLAALAAERAGPLPVRLMMVSHIDDDHIRGLLDLTDDLVDARKDRRPPRVDVRVQTLWHNSFEDLVGTEAETLAVPLAAAARAAAAGDPLPAGLPLDRAAAAVVASVAQGRQLRDNARALGIPLNRPVSALIEAPEQDRLAVPLGSGLRVTVLGPRAERVAALRAEWEEQLRRMRAMRPDEAAASAAAFVDRSVFNLSSLVLMAETDGARVLLTGDARGDDILLGLERAGLLAGGGCHVDLFKVPHHGSQRNVTEEFFRKVTADHYLISADGRHGNPDLDALRMILRARGAAEYRLWLTNREDRLTDFFAAERQPGRRFDVVFREAASPSIAVALGSTRP
jgi:hypothetical protein